MLRITFCAVKYLEIWAFGLDRFEHISAFLAVCPMSESEAKQSSQAGADIPDNAQDLTIFVQNLLEQMVSRPQCPNPLPSQRPDARFRQQQRFHQMSSSIVGRIDEMGNRIDDLEKSIADLMQQVSPQLTVLCSHTLLLPMHLGWHRLQGGCGGGGEVAAARANGVTRRDSVGSVWRSASLWRCSINHK